MFSIIDGVGVAAVSFFQTNTELADKMSLFNAHFCHSLNFIYFSCIWVYQNQKINFVYKNLLGSPQDNWVGGILYIEELDPSIFCDLCTLVFL